MRLPVRGSKTFRFNLFRPFLMCLALMALAMVLFGQQTDSNIVGTVTDASGAVVANAKVVATNTGTNVNYETTTGAAGDYRLNDVPVGTYDVAVTATGFAPRTISGVEADLNHTASVNVSLAVGSVSSTVEVTSAPALLDTTTSQLQSTYDSALSINSPLTGVSQRSSSDGSAIYNLSLLSAGVASQGGIGQGTGPSVAGQRPENNSFAIDGVSNNDTVGTGPQVYVSNEAVAELSVLQNQFSAEFGGASGGVFNVIVKTGTNSIHGALFEYFENRNLNAVDYQQVVAGNRSNPRYDNNRFGGGIGGPIIKDKLFYYANYEYNPIGQASVPGSPIDAPTAAGIALLNGMSNLSKTNLGVFEKYVPVASSVDPNNPYTVVNGVNIPLGQLTFASPNYNNAYHLILAIDYNLSSRDQIRGRYIYDNSTGLDNNANLPVFYQPNPTINNSASISEFHNFNPTLENELRLGYRRINAEESAGNFQFPGLSVFPNLAFDDLGLQLGPDPNAPQGQLGNIASVQDYISKTWRRHTFKVGYSLDDVIMSGFFVQRVRGDYDYATLQQYLLDQQPSGGNLSGVSGERSAGASSDPLGFLNNAAFAQDDWRVNENLTLNLGLRYEYVTQPIDLRAQQYSSIANVPGVITFGNPSPSKNDWSPRIGFAYSPGTDAKWTIRGGLGRSFDNTYGNLNENGAPAFYQTTQDVNPANPVSNFLANGGLSGAAPVQTSAAAARASISTYTWGGYRPYAMTGTLGIQRRIGNDYVVEARYTYTKGVHLWNQTRLNIVSPVTPTNSIPTYFTMPTAAQLASDTLTLGQVQSTIVPGGTAALPYNDLAAYGFTNNLVGYEPWGNSRYNGLALQVTRRYSHNLSYIAAYTWSHNFDDSTATNFSTILSPRRAQDFQNMTAEWASSALDRRQRFTFSPSYDFKPFQDGTWVMKNLVGNWNLSGTYTFQSPELVTIQSGVDSNLNGDSAGDRSITNPNGAANVGTGVTGINAAGQPVAAGSPSIVAYVANNPNARYVVAGLGALSDTGRNTFPMARTDNIDLGLTKKFAFTESRSFQIGVQLLNAFNHSQFTGGYLSDSSFFQTNAINRAVFVPSSSSFGQINNFFPSNSRQVTLVARLTF